MNAAELLRKHGITLTDTKPGRYYTTCPECSKDRKKPGHKSAECLGVTIDGDGVRWGCNHCGWTGPEKGGGGGKSELPSYIYRDRDGVIRFRKVRNRPGKEPRFWLEQPDGKGGWKKGTKGVDTTLIYRADEVKAAIEAGRTIAVVEGEKDADNFWTIDIPATCNAHGASEPGKRPKWHGDHADQLKGVADVVVLMDHDAAGYAHAEAVRGSLFMALYPRLRPRWLDLKNDWPDIPQGGDVSDWLAVGGDHTPERLKALIASAPYRACDRLPSDPDYALPERDSAPANDSAAAADDEPRSETESDAAPLDEDAELDRLAKLSLVEFDRARKAAAEKLGVRASILDKLVALKRSELGLDTKEDGKQGRPIEFQEVAPWDQPVDGAQLLGALVDILGKYVVMSEHQKVAIALWILHAYLIDRSMISPRLAIRSPVKGCGKTTLLDVLTRLVPRPLATANVSPSAIFRVIAGHRPTLLIDEADTLFKDGDETLRGILNAGHRQGGTVLRSVGDEHEPRAFACYAATVIALIGQLPGTLADRSIDIVLARRRPNEAITAFRLDRTESLDTLARQIARWAADNRERIGVTDPQVPPSIYNRAADNWRPLLAIAEAVGGDEWPEKARNAAVALVGGEVDEVSRLELLLGDIRDIFKALNWISSAELIENLVEITPRPWSEFGRGGKPITQNKLARLLKPFGITPDRLEVGEDRARGYFRAHFDDAFARYLPPEGVSKCPPVREPDKSGTSPTSQSVRDAGSRTDAKVQETQHSSHRGHMDTLKGGNGPIEPLGLSERTLDEVAEWVRAFASRHVGEPDINALIAQALRERLFNEYDVGPEDLDTEAERVMARAFGPLK